MELAGTIRLTSAQPGTGGRGPTAGAVASAGRPSGVGVSDSASASDSPSLVRGGARSDSASSRDSLDSDSALAGLDSEGSGLAALDSVALALPASVALTPSAGGDTRQDLEREHMLVGVAPVARVLAAGRRLDVAALTAAPV